MDTAVHAKSHDVDTVHAVPATKTN